MPTRELLATTQGIINAHRRSLADRRARTPIEALRALASMQNRPQPILTHVPNNAHVTLIGQIRPSQATNPNNYSPVVTAQYYSQLGIDALSLFTDDIPYEHGLDDMVMISSTVPQLPIISQNYVLEEYQIVEARAAGASALVLYAPIVSASALRELVSLTQRNLMTTIIQVENEEQLTLALDLCPYVIGLSNNEVWTGTISPGRMERLRQRISTPVHLMAMDALGSLEAIENAVKLGVTAVVVQERLLRDRSTLREVNQLLRKPAL